VQIKKYSMKKVIQYFKDSYNELVHKVSWPTRAELSNSAVVVLFASIIIAIVVFAVDFVFEHAMRFVYNSI
jgi:preprotein translocase subunit SecE